MISMANPLYPLYTLFALSWHILTSDRNEIWARDLYHSTALVEAAKSLALSNITEYGKVLYQKPWLKCMAHGVHPHVVQCISAMRGANLSERGIVPTVTLDNGVVDYMKFTSSHL